MFVRMYACMSVCNVCVQCKHKGNCKGKCNVKICNSESVSYNGMQCNMCNVVQCLYCTVMSVN